MESELLYTKMSSESRGDIAGDHHCLDRDRTRSTHRVREGSCIFPVGKCDECCSEILFDWCLACLSSVSTLVEWITCDIEEDMTGIVDDEDEDVDLDPVRQIGSIERREYRPLAHTLDRRGVFESRSRGCRLDDDPLLAREIVCPLEGVQCIIEGIEILDSGIC